jgi:hypothetical protein
MKSGTTLYVTLSIFLVLGGCSMMKATGTSTTLPSSAFFAVDASELQSLQTIAHAQDERMRNCHKGSACEDAYYTRGLIALFENRANAITVFQELHTAMPNSRYEVATMGWLNLLQDNALSSKHSRALLIQLKQAVLHNILERSDLAGTRNMKDYDRRVAEVNR